MSQFLEATMLICFGISWPINLYKNRKAKTARHMSLPFILLILTGYLAGIAAKVSVHSYTYVLFIYLFNLVIVLWNLFIYFRNLHFDRLLQKSSFSGCNALIQEMPLTDVDILQNLQAAKRRNSYAEPESIVFFGDASLAQIPFYELAQQAQLETPVYNRAFAGIQLCQAVQAARLALDGLSYQDIFIRFSHHDERSAFQSMTTDYTHLIQALKYFSKGQIWLLASDEDSPLTSAWNKQLKVIAQSEQCQYLDVAECHTEETLFHRLLPVLRSNPLNFATAMSL